MECFNSKKPWFFQNAVDGGFIVVIDDDDVF